MEPVTPSREAEGTEKEFRRVEGPRHDPFGEAEHAAGDGQASTNSNSPRP
jgi:hypothetical protein